MKLSQSHFISILYGHLSFLLTRWIYLSCNGFTNHFLCDESIFYFHFNAIPFLMRQSHSNYFLFWSDNRIFVILTHIFTKFDKKGGGMTGWASLKTMVIIFNLVDEYIFIRRDMHIDCEWMSRNLFELAWFKGLVTDVEVHSPQGECIYTGW